MITIPEKNADKINRLRVDTRLSMDESVRKEIMFCPEALASKHLQSAQPEHSNHCLLGIL